jgi:hypothetical protein
MILLITLIQNRWYHFHDMYICSSYYYYLTISVLKSTYIFLIFCNLHEILLVVGTPKILYCYYIMRVKAIAVVERIFLKTN